MNTRAAMQLTAEVGSLAEKPRPVPMRLQLACLVGGSSVTAPCHAATAPPTREYQGEHRRTCLPSVVICILRSLDKSFHIRNGQR